MSLAINPDRYIARRPDGGFYSEADQLEYQAQCAQQREWDREAAGLNYDDGSELEGDSDDDDDSFDDGSWLVEDDDDYDDSDLDDSDVEIDD